MHLKSGLIIEVVGFLCFFGVFFFGWGAYNRGTTVYVMKFLSKDLRKQV